MTSSIHANRRWLPLGLVIALASTGGLGPQRARAQAPASAGDSLAAQAQAEYQAAGDALRERLAHAAAGDFVGAALAERDRQTHRAKFLDLQQALARLSHARDPSVPVMERADPFAAEPGVKPPALVAAHAVPPRASRASAARWDMYVAPAGARLRSPADSNDDASPTPARGWGMYQTADAVELNVSSSHLSESPEREAASRPFLVYRSADRERSMLSPR